MASPAPSSSSATADSSSSGKRPGRRGGLGSLLSLLQPGGGGGSKGGQQLPQASADLEEDERRLQRLAKNRESAQRSRQRKKEYLELLQERVHQTNATLEALRLAHVQEGAPRLAEAQRAALEQLDGDGVEAADVEECLRAFGPFAEERQALVAHDCQRLQSLVLPPPARFWLWLAQQPDSFFAAATEQGLPSPSPSSSSLAVLGSAPASASASASVSAPAQAAPSAAKAGEWLMQNGAQSCGVGPELWPLLCFELQLKVEQEQQHTAAAGAHREELLASGQLEEVAATLAEVDTLEAELLGASRLLHAKLQALHQVLTPAQALKLEQALAAAASSSSCREKDERLVWVG